MMKKPKNITKKAGVYLFKNAQSQIVYIGKAKNLFNRIASYFNNPDDFKNGLILSEAVMIDTIPTNSEQEALYLEVDLIKKYQPKFNQLLKDGNPFVYLFFSQGDLPELMIVRTKTKTKKGVYVGPFLTKKIARSIYNFLLKTFQLKLCTKKIANGCLQYHIGVCSGFCSKNFDFDFYKFRLKLAEFVLTKQPEHALTVIDQQIKQASKSMQFEKAKYLLECKLNFEKFIDTIEKLEVMPSKQKVNDLAKNLPLLEEVRKRLYLKHVPYVIDCFDISHMQGKAIVGSCIRYVNGLAEQSSFRRFKIQSLIDQNDYAALAEIVQRRYRLKNNYPNLIIVDGGKGQISAIAPYIGSAELVGLAKKEETIITSNFSHFIVLDVHRPSDALILQIRDKAHQFAVSYHRKKMKIIESE